MSFRPFPTAVVLGVVLSLAVLSQTSSAESTLNERGDYASPNHGLVGQPGAVGGRTSKAGSIYPAVDGSVLSTAGKLIHDDHLPIEAEAKRLLEANKQFRQDISPHNEKPDFDKLVRQFDYVTGFDRKIPDQPMTLAERIDQADLELRRARDLYAFLAVYADEGRFRNQRGYCSQQPMADDPFADPPVVDWCNFSARMRESVREVAYLRMIFGQQFTADALGLHFSGTEIVGGEAFVIDEVRKLELALEQYEAAQTAVFEGMTRAIGNGCYISDFYAQPEWALTSRAVDGRERAQHHIAVRKSYLDVYGVDEAQDDLRAASVEQYAKLIGIAGISNRATDERCRRGTNPDSALLAEMALRLAETRQQSRTMSEGRNIFGFDIQFTPARPLLTDHGSGDTGLLDEAQEAVDKAKDLQRDEEAATRVFDSKATELRKAIQSLKSGRDENINGLSGCDRNGFDDDESYFACVQQTIDTLATCDPSTADDEAFDACVRQAPIGALRLSRQELRIVYLQYKRIETELGNILVRASVEELRNIKVKKALFGAAQENSLFEAAIIAANCCPMTFGVLGFEGVSINAGAAVEAGLRPGQIMRQAAHDMEIEDAEKEAIVRNLFLDQAELQVELDIAMQEYNAKLTEYLDAVGQTQHDVIEARRDRAYLQNSPANDPSFRLVRDSKRLALASQLEYAARVSYLAARRAEYEYAARLNANGLRVSDLYRARIANDLDAFLRQLKSTFESALQEDSAVNQEDLTISVPLHVLGLTDGFLGLSGDAAEAERQRRFQAWVAENTRPSEEDGKPVLAFDFSTSLVDNGVFSNVIQQAFNRFWLFKLSGVGQPKAGNTGMSMNLVTNQPGDLGHRTVAVTQSGVTHLRSRAGCIFDYRLIHPAALLGQEWPTNQDPYSVTAAFSSNVNGAAGAQTAAFLGRPASASSWKVQIFGGAPSTNLPDLDMSQLTDIELKFSTTRATRDPGDPQPEDCVRGDF